MERIKTNLLQIRQQLPASVCLVAVSKFHPAEAVRQAYQAGQRVFAESRAQELVKKVDELNGLSDIQWHFIGPIQTNKLKMILPHVSMVQSVSSVRLLDEIEKYAAKLEKKVDVLCEIHIAQEETKSGFSPEEFIEFLPLLQSPSSYPHLEVRGLMGMASLTENEVKVRGEFASLRQLYEKSKNLLSFKYARFDTLSMGMSGDFPLAISEGATMIRVGSSIFGEREY